MKSILFVACASLLIASTIGATIKADSCPKPTKPKAVSFWYFNFFSKVSQWTEIGRTDKDQSWEILWEKSLPTYPVYEKQPVSYNIKTKDGKDAIVWMPMYNNFNAVLVSCANNGDGTIEIVSWYAAPTYELAPNVSTIPEFAQTVAKSFTGKELQLVN